MVTTHDVLWQEKVSKIFEKTTSLVFFLSKQWPNMLRYLEVKVFFFRVLGKYRLT